MAPKKDQKVNSIKVGKFQFKTGNFWLTVLCFLMIQILGVTAIISFTCYKILDMYKDPIIEAVVRIHQIKFHANQTPIQIPQETDNERVVIQQGSSQD